MCWHGSFCLLLCLPRTLTKSHMGPTDGVVASLLFNNSVKHVHMGVLLCSLHFLYTYKINPR